MHNGEKESKIMQFLRLFSEACYKQVDLQVSKCLALYR